MTTDGDAFWSIIPAGGAGTRLWPLSRSARPKFLLNLASDRSLLQQTYDRLLPLSPPERILIVTGPAHATEIARQLPDVPPENILIEPSPKGTGPAIGLASFIIAQRDPDAVIGSFAADHVVTDEAAFRQAVNTAIAAANEAYLVTIGLTPTRPETGFGYIKRTDETVVSDADGIAWRADSFTEKPDAATAERFVDSGRYLWNASMFIWRAADIVAAFSKHQPATTAVLTILSESWGDLDEDLRSEHWRQIRNDTIDEGIMEKTDRFAVVQADVGWSDIGDWSALAELLVADANGNRHHGAGVEIDSRSCVAWSSSGKLIAIVGLENVVVVETPDAILVLDRNKAQNVKEVVERLRTEREDLL